MSLSAAGNERAEKYVGDNPDMAERPYGEAMAVSLSRGFPCKAL